MNEFFWQYVVIAYCWYCHNGVRLVDGERCHHCTRQKLRRKVRRRWRSYVRLVGNAFPELKPKQEP